MFKLAWIKTILYALFCMICIPSFAAVDPVKPVKVIVPPVLDGKLDDEIWQTAPSVTGFRTFVPDFEKPLGFKTEVVMAYDEDNLYFGFKCEDKPNLIKTSLAQRDKIRNDDWVCINLDSYNDHQSLYALYINPSGIQMDTRYSNGVEDAGADFVWYSKAIIHDEGYTVEVRIPLKSIRYSVRKGLVDMGVIFERKISRLSMQATYPPMDPDKGFAFLIQSMPLQYEGLKPNTLLELLPAVTYGEGRTFAEGEKHKTGGKTEIGLTGKWGISSDLVLDATYNPDFSQVESDASQIEDNLRFAVLFPERRLFFLEGSEMFNVAGMGGDGLRAVVNTRTIVDPDAAFKFSGKIGSKNRFATIFASDNTNQLNEEENKNDQVYIGRFIRALKGDSFIGGIYTRRASEESANDVAGIDGTIRLSQSSTISTHLINSFTKLSSEPDTRHESASLLQYTKDQRNFTFQAQVVNLSQDFSTAVGFVGRTGMTEYSFFANPKIYPESKILNRIDNQFTIAQTYDHPSGLWEKNYGYTFRTRWIRSTTIGVGFALRDEIFRGIKFNRNQYNATASSQVNKRLQLGLNFMKSNKIRYIFEEDLLPYSGRGIDLSANLNWQASDQFSSVWTMLYSNFTRESDGIKEFDRTIIRARNIFQLNQFFFLRAILEYDTRAKDLFTDYLASFTLIPGTVVHFGYGALYDHQEWNPSLRNYREVDHFRRRKSSFFFKASYLWRM